MQEHVAYVSCVVSSLIDIAQIYIKLINVSHDDDEPRGRADNVCVHYYLHSLLQDCMRECVSIYVCVCVCMH